MNKQTLSLLLLLSIGICLAGARRTGATRKFYQESIRDQFNGADNNKNGFLERNEFGTFIRPFIRSESQNDEISLNAEINKYFAEADINKDQKLSFEELQALLTKEATRIEFNLADKNGSGELDREELFQLFLPMMEKDNLLPDQQQNFLQRALSAIDSNGNGQVSLQEFEKYANSIPKQSQSKYAQLRRGLNKTIVKRIESYLRKIF